MTDIIYYGPFKEHIENHVKLKQSVGYKYITEAKHLKRFDIFTLEKYSFAVVLTKEIILDWCSKKPYEAQANQCTRASIIRQFSRYLDNIGVETYIMPKRYYPKERQYVPHIYTDEELKRFFAETEKCHYSPEFPYRHLIMPVFFRMLYACGLRLSEARLLKVADVTLDSPAVIVLTGKCNKTRRVPIMKNTIALLHSYLSKNNLNAKWKNQYPFFSNNQHNKLTKEGVAYIIAKYVEAARKLSTIVPRKVKPHMLRHSKAMHLLQAGVNLIYIRDFLGHADIKTTEIYARTDTETKRKAIENAYPDLIDSDLPDWNKDQKLLSWLSTL